MAKKKRIIIANWKMNPASNKEALALFDGVKKKVSRIKNVETIICPPFIYLPQLTQKYSGKSISFGTQNVSGELSGAYTGEVSANMIKSVGARFVIIGHSERRAMGEDNEVVRKKVRMAMKAGLKIILCIGESERDEHAHYLKFLREQLTAGLRGITKNMLADVIVAYEPIWAIGKTADEAMQPHDLHEMTIYIKKILTEEYDKKIGLSVPVIYGGSAEPKNCESLLVEGTADGFLVGHASLRVEDFSTILEVASKV